MLKVICFGWIIGIACIGQSFLTINSFSSPWLLILGLLLAGQSYVSRQLKNPYLLFLNASLAGVLSLFLGIQYGNLKLQERLMHREMQIEPSEVVVYITKINQISPNSIQQPIRVLNRHDQAVEWLAFQKKPLTLPMQLGQYYRLQGRILPAHAYAVTGSFDQEQWYLQQNIMAGFQVQHVQPISVGEMQQLGYGSWVQKHQKIWPSMYLWVEKQRYQIREFIQQQPLQHQGLLLALLTGDKSLLDQKIEDDFQRFGMSHLLAISGPHVLIFAMLLCWLLKCVIERYMVHVYLICPRPYLLIGPFLFCVGLYCACVGFEIPALRTFLICLLSTILLLLRQAFQPLVLLLMSASLLLYFDPLSILSAAFWLSYGACFILLRIYQTLAQQDQAKTPHWWQKIYFNFKLLVESQWKIFLALLPLMLLFFKQIAWISPLTNLIAIPYLGLLVVPLDVLAGLSYFIFPPLAHFIFQLNDNLLSGLLGLLAFLDHILSIKLYFVALTVWQIMSIMLALVILFLPRGTLPKFWAVICLLPVFFVSAKKQNFELHILDVGQGQALFIRQHEQTMLIDTGGSHNEAQFSLGKQVLIPFLSRAGVRHLDQVILTHLDQDHSGAYASIAERVPVLQLMSNQQPENTTSPFRYCEQGYTWRWQEVQFEILSPRQQNLSFAEQERNEYSCVVYMQVKNAQPYQHFVFMGDAGWQTEYQILQQYPDLKIDVLVLGHHGSRHSSAYDFLAYYRPKLAIASAGWGNRYGHPSIQLQARLKALDIPLLTTIEQGSIRFALDQQHMQISTTRQQKTWLHRHVAD